MSRALEDRVAHPPTTLPVLGFLPAGSTGTLFLFGIAVGAVVSLGLGKPARTRRVASQAADARLAAADFRRQSVFIDQARDTKRQHQARADAA